MSLSSVLDGTVRLIQTHADFSTNNTYKNDYRHINAGQERYAVVGFGSLQAEEIAIGGVFSNNWNIGIDLYTRFTGEMPGTWNNANDNLQSIVTTIQGDNTLADTTGVWQVAITNIGPIQPMDAGNGRVAHVLQQISLVVKEEP